MRISDELSIDEAELEVVTTTSRGPGGQHVNRSETRVVLRWNVLASASLTDAQRERLLDKLGTRISQDGVLQVAAEDHRSQSRNRDLARERLASLVRDALKRDKPRRPTRPTRASRKRRIDEKKRRGELKKSRGRPSDD
jgi:ribosome-associated protein